MAKPQPTRQPPKEFHKQDILILTFRRGDQESKNTTIQESHGVLVAEAHHQIS